MFSGELVVHQHHQSPTSQNIQQQGNNNMFSGDLGVQHHEDQSPRSHENQQQEEVPPDHAHAGRITSSTTRSPLPVRQKLYGFEVGVRIALLLVYQAAALLFCKAECDQPLFEWLLVLATLSAIRLPLRIYVLRSFDGLLRTVQDPESLWQEQTVFMREDDLVRFVRSDGYIVWLLSSVLIFFWYLLGFAWHLTADTCKDTSPGLYMSHIQILAMSVALSSLGSTGWLLGLIKLQRNSMSVAAWRSGAQFDWDAEIGGVLPGGLGTPEQQYQQGHYRQGLDPSRIGRLKKFKFSTPPPKRELTPPNLGSGCKEEEETTSAGGDSSMKDDEGSEDSKMRPSGFFGDACSICLCDFLEGDELRQLPCGHVFCAECVDGWLLISRDCPMRCKLDVETGLQLQDLEEGIVPGDGGVPALVVPEEDVGQISWRPSLEVRQVGSIGPGGEGVVLPVLSGSNDEEDFAVARERTPRRESRPFSDDSLDPGGPGAFFAAI